MDATARSKKMKSGLEKAPHRSLLYALGLTREEMDRPLVGVVNAANEVVPGHMHLNTLADAVKAGVRMAGGTPLQFPAIAVCDGLAMNHEGMRFSLPSREFIADSIEIMARAHAFDALVFIPNCDKCVPGMLMAMMRLNIPSVLVSGGPMLPGNIGPHQRGDLITLSIRQAAVHGISPAGVIQCFSACSVQKQLLKARPIQRVNGVELPVQHDAIFPTPLALIVQPVIDPDPFKVHLVQI